MGASAGPDVIDSGLVLALDAADLNSYDKYENLLTYSEDFGNAIWTKSNIAVTTTNSAIAPNGTLSADTLGSATGGSNTSYVYQINNTNAAVTFSFYAKATTSGQYAFIDSFDTGFPTNDNSNRARATVSLDTGSISYLSQTGDGEIGRAHV